MPEIAPPPPGVPTGTAPNPPAPKPTRRKKKAAPKVLKEPEPPIETKVILDKLAVDIPVMLGLNGYSPRRCDVMLNQKQSERLRDILHALTESGAKLANGQPVTRPARAIQWLLEQG